MILVEDHEILMGYRFTLANLFLSTIPTISITRNTMAGGHLVAVRGPELQALGQSHYPRYIFEVMDHLRVFFGI